MNVAKKGAVLQNCGLIFHDRDGSGPIILASCSDSNSFRVAPDSTVPVLWYRSNFLLTANLVPPFGYQFSTSIYPTAVQVVPHSLLPVAGCSQDVLLAARLHPAYMLGEEGSQETSKCEDLPHQKT